MDSIKEEIQQELKKTKIVKADLYNLLAKIADELVGGNGAEGKQGPRGMPGEPGPAGPAGPPGECKCKSTAPAAAAAPKKTAAKKTAAKKAAA